MSQARTQPPAARVGMLGGAFDPPHLTHAALAREAIAQCQLDVLHVVPSGNPPHRVAATASAEHRIAMLEVALRSQPKARLDRRELDASEPGYTVNTMRSLGAEHPSAALFLVIGQDQWERFATWHQAEELQLIATIVVAARDLSTRTDSQNRVKIDPRAACEAPGGTTRWLEHLPSAHSATAVRRALAVRDQAVLASMLDPDVLRYIEAHDLYR